MISGKKFVAIAGNVGVGKSTLTQLLADRLEWEAFYEAVDENPYLADFYGDMRSWSFHSQVFFLSRRLKHLRQSGDLLRQAEDLRILIACDEVSSDLPRKDRI